MHERERIPKKMIEKYKDEIIFMVSIDECIIKVVEPRIVWILAMGYEIIEQEIISLVNFMLIKPKDTTKR